MTALIVNDKSEHTLHKPTHLIPVVIKKNKLHGPCCGEILNGSAVHGRGYVVRRITGPNVQDTMQNLTKIISSIK